MTKWQIEMRAALENAIKEHNRARNAGVKEALRIQIEAICKNLGIEAPKPRLPNATATEIAP